MEDRDLEKISNERRIHPKDEGGFLQHFFFCWQLLIFIKGWKKDLTEDDLSSPLKEHESKALGDKLEKAWKNEELFHKNRSLWRALIKIFGIEWITIGIIFLPVHIAASLLQPYLLSSILDYFTENQESKHVFMYATSLLFIVLIHGLCTNLFHLEMKALGMKIRIASSSLIYRRILKLPKRKVQKLTVGYMINLLSNDVSRFDTALTFVHYIWLTIIEVICVIIYMNVQMGPESITGIGSLILCLLLQICLSRKFSQMRSRVAYKTDRRMCLINDVISNIQAIKMHTWEEPFTKIVQSARDLEMKEIKIANYYKLGVNTFKVYLAPLCVFFGALALILTDSTFTPQFVYSMTIIYKRLMISMTACVPQAFIHLSECDTSVQRVQEFLLNTEEKMENMVEQFKKIDLTEKLKSLKSARIYLKNVTVKWNHFLTVNSLRNITLSVHPEELVCVVGTAGSGKSTLLQVILNEIEATEGTVSVEGTISYASQTPWIFPSSVRQNILFGSEMNLSKYNKIVKICGLEHDLNLFSHGDRTLVGERGVLLSGGQKARINLARAIYKDADIYLLDDPLSAVDARVARHILTECILGYLKDKCVVLVTHQVQFLRKSGKIYFLEDGKIQDCGKYETITGLNSKFLDEGATVSEATSLKQHKVVDQVKEHRSSGTNSKVYKRYCSFAGRWYMTCAVISAFVLSQFFVNTVDYFLGVYVNIETNLIDVKEYSRNFRTQNFLYLYVLLLACVISTISLTVVFFVKYAARVSKNLHKTLLTNIVHGTMTFFNNHSSGRILNRFAKDIGVIDEILPMNLMNIITTFLAIIGSCLLVSIANFWMIIMSLSLVAIMCLWGFAFQRTNRNLKRTEAITRSSLFTHVTATLQGLTTIRAANAQEILSQEFDKYQNLHISAFYLLTAMYGAFGFWTDIVGVLYVAFVVLGFILIPNDFSIGFIGLAITLSIAIVARVEHLVKILGETEIHITSVERVIEYIDLPLEFDNKSVILPKEWPMVGNITFDTVSLQYSPEEPLVLKKISFHIQGGQKIGIVGRTGAGKTSLISALFRLHDFKGTIIIDGIDTKSLSLKELRSKISIIPQDPVLFVGSLRKNVDPFGEFSDEQIWGVLNEFDLTKMLSGLPAGLDTKILEGGSNFSVGQKQLLGLVRIFLRNSRIIVLDEATANVDLKTDEFIQKIIRKKFAHCTVLTIAHRLNTVIDSDKVLVVDDGRVVEFAHPYMLLQDERSLFYAFVKGNGKKFLQDLIMASRSSLKL